MLRTLLKPALAATLLLPAMAAHTQTVVSTQPQARVIVKFKADTGMARIASASDRMQVLSRGLGRSLQGRGHIAEDTQVVTASGISSAELAKQLAANPYVAYASEDALMRVQALPNDPMFAQQWHLQAAQPAAINSQAAWDVTTGNSSIVVAVLDTGVRFEHEDIAGKLLPGYDFISDTTISNDGDGRDADATDPGDWEVDSSGATVSNSTWHGTRVSSIIAASTSNARGIAGVAWNSRILPVRVLGSGGGYVSDIVAGMRWAAGLNVPGIPDNPNPARVINLSLGGSGSCDPSYQQAVNEISARGTLVVVAAGNLVVNVQRPANCAGVLAVGGLRHAGSKVGYSAWGPQVSIAAPAGNCVQVQTGQVCQFPIDAATNTGTTVPASNGYTSNINPNANVGTSFSAPQAAGVAALMLAANPALTPGKLIERIKAAARAFPTEAGLQSCNVAVTAGEQCNCTTSTCGAGMLDAPGSVTQSLRPVALINAASAMFVGGALPLDGSSSAASSGRTIASYLWSVSGTGVTLGNANQATTSLSGNVAGTYQITLQVTDNEGRVDTTSSTVSVQAIGGASSSSSSSSSGGETGSSSGGGGGGGAVSLLGLLGVLGLARLSRRRPLQPD